MTPDNELFYIGLDDNGNRYNKMCAPDRKKYGDTYGGYANNAREVLFYDFAVQGYDVEFKYRGNTYHLLYEPDHAALCDSRYNEEFQSFDNPMSLIDELRIEGNPLREIIDELTDVEPV